MREATHGCDRLLSQIVLCLGIHRIILQCLTNAVNLFVDLGTMMIASLTGAWHVEGHTSRMPGANACNLSETTMCLACQAGHTPSGHHTVETLALGGTDHINHLILAEAICNLHFLLKQTHDKIHLGLCGTTIHLNLLDVGLLLSNLCLAHLSVTNGTDHLTVLLGSLHFGLHGSTLLTFGFPFFLVLGEGLLLAVVPVLVETAFALLGEVASPNGSQSTKTSRSFNIADKAHHHHRRTFQDGHWLNDLLLIQLGARPVHLTHNVRHSCFVAHEGSQMWLLGLVIFGKALDLAMMVLGPLPGQETQRAMAWTFELAMRHGYCTA
mmetsp:Transcript_98879/g.137328  ORF Transcript_98879/g.137328 Transcript_98879/m.137328 type:complete len:324 (+) Transcript_98879:306-1277(+)